MSTQRSWYKNISIATLGKGSSNKLIFTTKKKVVARAKVNLWASHYFDYKVKTFSSKQVGWPIEFEVFKIVNNFIK